MSPRASRPGTRRGVSGAVAVALLVPAAVFGPGAIPPAVAEPPPSLAQVQRQVDALHHQAEQATERFNTARVELADTTRRLRAVRHRLDDQRQEYEVRRAVVGRLASASYRSGTVDPVLALALSDDPTTFLRRAGDLATLTRRQATQLRDLAVARQRLLQDRRAARQQRAAAAALRERLAAERRTVEARLGKATRLLDSLRAEQQQRLARQQRAARLRALAVRDDAQRASRTARDGSFPTYDGPASGRAAVAVRTAYEQLGDPYVWGAAGPGAFDCSGLTMFAWRAAGVALPHSSSAQYSATRRIAVSDLEPGDLVFYYSPISHVAMYVGGGKVIDAPYPGRSVQIVPLYSMPVVGAGRP